jgi:hypothetical protein
VNKAKGIDIDIISETTGILKQPGNDSPSPIDGTLSIC